MAGRPKKKAAGSAGSKKVKPSGPVPCAVLWGLDPSDEKGAAVRAVLKEMGVVARTALPERLGDPAGAFARMPGFRPAVVPYAGPEPVVEEFVRTSFSPARARPDASWVPRRCSPRPTARGHSRS